MARTDLGFAVPKNIKEYVLSHGDRLSVEQTVLDVVNGYGCCVQTRITISRYVEWCEHCKLHSLFSPNYRPDGLHRHRWRKEFVTIFEWDDYSPNSIPLETSFEIFRKEYDGKWNMRNYLKALKDGALCQE